MKKALSFISVQPWWWLYWESRPGEWQCNIDGQIEFLQNSFSELSWHHSAQISFAGLATSLYASSLSQLHILVDLQLPIALLLRIPVELLQTQGTDKTEKVLKDFRQPNLQSRRDWTPLANSGDTNPREDDLNRNNLINFLLINSSAIVGCFEEYWWEVFCSSGSHWTTYIDQLSLAYFLLL